MINVIKRPHYDEHSFEIFRDLSENLNISHDAFYTWSEPPWELESFLKKLQPTENLVLLGIKDLLECYKEFDYWNDQQQYGVRLLDDLFRRYPEKRFILFTSLENLGAELSVANARIVPWGGDIVNQKTRYLKIEPVLDKNFSSAQTFINLNRHSRDHRVVTMSYLLGSGFDQFGNISYLGKSIIKDKIPNFLDRIGWQFDQPKHDNIRDRIIQGYQILMDRDLAISQDDYEIYKTHGDGPNDNASNFESSLRAKYRNSFVEIVAESSFPAPAFFLTEKTANSFYACNFPIMLSGCGAVQHLRDLGLDVFDDIIDHGYDLISNPFDRIVAAIENNRRILIDGDMIKSKWIDCRQRFVNNVSVIKKIYDWYEKRTRILFTEHINDFFH